MSKRGKVVTCLILALVMVVSCVPLFASAAGPTVVRLAEGQAWTRSYYAGTHTAGYDSAAAECDAVYPINSIVDLFFACQCRAVNSSGVQIGADDYVVLQENGGRVRVYLSQGMQNTPSVYFQFRGNTDKAAEAVVSYYGTW